MKNASTDRLTLTFTGAKSESADTLRIRVLPECEWGTGVLGRDVVLGYGWGSGTIALSSVSKASSKALICLRQIWGKHYTESEAPTRGPHALFVNVILGKLLF